MEPQDNKLTARWIVSTKADAPHHTFFLKRYCCALHVPPHMGRTTTTASRNARCIKPWACRPPGILPYRRGEESCGRTIRKEGPEHHKQRGRGRVDHFSRHLQTPKTKKFTRAHASQGYRLAGSCVTLDTPIPFIVSKIRAGPASYPILDVVIFQ